MNVKQLDKQGSELHNLGVTIFDLVLNSTARVFRLQTPPKWLNRLRCIFMFYCVCELFDAVTPWVS